MSRDRVFPSPPSPRHESYRERETVVTVIDPKFHDTARYCVMYALLKRSSPRHRGITEEINIREKIKGFIIVFIFFPRCVTSLKRSRLTLASRATSVVKQIRGPWMFDNDEEG